MLEDAIRRRAARQNIRSEQVNLRLTPEEKAVLESAAEARDQSIADYVRAALVENA